MSYNLLTLVNRENPLSCDFVPPSLSYCRIIWADNIESSDKYCLYSEAALMLEYLCAIAARHSVYITGVSGYRSYKRQEEIYSACANKTYVAAPGYSEHQTGLAIDLSCSDINNELTDDFEGTDAYRFLIKYGPRFGFIPRYSKAHAFVTDYPFEPWHFRYVGRIPAMSISERGLCLEQYCRLQKS